MLKLENGRFTVITIELLSLVIEHTEEGLKHIGAKGGESVEDTLNEVRRAVNFQLNDLTSYKKNVVNSWKRFQACKEFMDERELARSQLAWGDFDYETWVSKKDSSIAHLSQALFEITDFILENNLTLQSLDTEEDTVEAKNVSLDDIKNMLDGLGKSQ